MTGTEGSHTAQDKYYVAVAASVGNLPKVHYMDIQFAQSMGCPPCDLSLLANVAKAEGAPNTEDKKSNIMQWVIAIVNESGLSAVKMGDVAKKAGIASGTVYIYWSQIKLKLCTLVHFAFSEPFGPKMFPVSSR